MIRTGKKECRHPGKTKREGVQYSRCLRHFIDVTEEEFALEKAFPQAVEVLLSVRIGLKRPDLWCLKAGSSMSETHLTKGVAGSLVDLLDGAKIRQGNDVSLFKANAAFPVVGSCNAVLQR